MPAATIRPPGDAHVVLVLVDRQRILGDPLVGDARDGVADGCEADGHTLAVGGRIRLVAGAVEASAADIPRKPAGSRAAKSLTDLVGNFIVSLPRR